MVPEGRGTSAQGKPGVVVRLVSVPLDGSITVRCLGPCQGILTHGKWRKAVACPGEESCPATTHRSTTIWKGYAPVEVWEEVPIKLWVPAVLEITEHLWEAMHERKLRGTVWVLNRVSDGRRDKICEGLMVDKLDPLTLRTDVLVEPVVCRVWRSAHIKFGALPLIKPRQTLLASVDTAPVTATPPVDPREVPGTPEWEEDRRRANELVKAALKPSKNGNGKARH